MDLLDLVVGGVPLRRWLIVAAAIVGTVSLLSTVASML